MCNPELTGTPHTMSIVVTIVSSQWPILANSFVMATAHGPKAVPRSPVLYNGQKMLVSWQLLGFNAHTHTQTTQGYLLLLSITFLYPMCFGQFVD